MSYETNQEWIEANNARIDNIKTQVDNLPDYQDIKYLYDYTDYAIYNTKQSNNVQSFYKNYFVISSGDNFYLRKIDENGNIISYSKSLENNYSGTSGIALLDVDELNEKVYYYSCYYYTTAKLREYDLKSNTINDIVTKQLYNTNWYRLSPLTYGMSGKMMDSTGAYSVFVNYDFLNKSLNSSNISSNYAECYNEDIISKNNRKEIKSVLNLKTYSSASVINFINRYSSKIILNNNLYYFSSDTFTVGELIRENIFENYNINYISVNLFGDFYYVCDKDNKSVGTLYKFDEDTNTFSTEQQITTGGTITVRALQYKNSSNQVVYVFGNKQTRLIGYEIDGNKFYLHKDMGVNSDKIVVGTMVYDYAGNQINGTMPNNGTLTYTPSTSQQTIPAGYTDGGTISAIDYSGQGALSPEDTATAEEQIADLFGEEENE